MSDFSLHGWIVAVTVRVDSEYAERANKKAVDLNFIGKSTETDREKAESEVLAQYQAQPFVNYIEGVQLPVDLSTLHVVYAEPYKPRGADLPTGQYL
jgi:hypothetical protein